VGVGKAASQSIGIARLNDQLISVASMQRYIHSPDFAPMENELSTYWVRLGRFLVATLNR